MRTAVQKPLIVRKRLLRRLCYRAWKSILLWRLEQKICHVSFEAQEDSQIPLPSLILSSYETAEDFLILSAIFRGREIILLTPKDLPKNKTVNRLKEFNLVMPIKTSGLRYADFKNIITHLKLFSRSLVVSPAAAAEYFGGSQFKLSIFCRIAMKANAPIQPVVIRWGGKSKKQCFIHVGKRIFISPRHPEFKDIFFRRKDPRKFSKLSADEYEEIGFRVMKRFNLLKAQYGSNLS